jgi:hypothetical protein
MINDIISIIECMNEGLEKVFELTLGIGKS